MTNGKIVKFAAEGVIFTIPANKPDVYVVKLPLKNPDTGSGSFKKAKRPILYFKLIQIMKNGKTKIVTDFNPPLEIEVHYKDVDDTNAGGAGSKQLAYYADVNKKWTRITKTKNGFDPKPYRKGSTRKRPNFKGYGIAKFKNLPDPVIGWGP